MAAAITDWIREEIAPAVADKLGSPLRAVENFDSFSCRGRNRVTGAQLSEHGKANAIDIRSFKLVNGTTAQPTNPNVPKEFRDGMRKGACERFKTVLGPGSDGYHEDHIHVDSCSGETITGYASGRCASRSTACCHRRIS